MAVYEGSSEVEEYGFDVELGHFTCSSGVWWRNDPIAFIKERRFLFCRGSVLYSSVRQRLNAAHIESKKTEGGRK